MFDSLWAQRTVVCQAPLSMGIFPRKVSGLPFPPPGDLPNPGIKPRSHALRVDSLLSEPWGKPENTGVVAYPFSRGSSQPRNWTGVSCIADRFFTSWATREAQIMAYHSTNTNMVFHLLELLEVPSTVWTVKPDLSSLILVEFPFLLNQTLSFPAV